MSKPGPLSNFNETEKQICRSLYAQYITKALDEKGVFTALGRDQEMYKKFQDYTTIMKTLLEPKQSESEYRQLLVNKINNRKDLIISMRERTAAAKTMPATIVSSINLKC